jgi:DNA polymerase-3 subunit gamma/tau
MPAEVLYRKWRPQRFADVSGQDMVTRTLVNAVASDRVSHAYLFSGPRGTGKTTTARLLAKAINCEKNQKSAKDKPGEPCNECASCKAVAEGTALDLIELDGASNRGIDDIRSLRENTGYMPMGGTDAHKVYLIDEVHMLTDPAFNALLKTLEEPPAHIVFILATTDVHKVPATIVSRCQRHEFKRIPLAAMADRLELICREEGISVGREALELISRTATGSLRDAINLLEQICDSYGTSPSIEAVRDGLGLIADERASKLALQAVHGDFSGGLTTIGEVRDDGLDLRQFKKEVVMRLRELLHVKSGAANEGQWTPEQVDEMRASVADVERGLLVAALRAFGQADLRADPLSPLPLELALADTVAPPPPAQAAPVSAPETREPTPIRRTEPMSRPAAPPRAATTPSRPQPAPRTSSEVPPELRKDLSSASAEDIARMLGSKAPVIPPAGESDDVMMTTASPPVASSPAVEVAPTPISNGQQIASTPGGTVDLDTFIDQKLRPLAKQRQMKLDALLNGSCRVISYEGGVLTLGFFQDAHHKRTVEQAQNRKIYEELASQLLGEPVTIQCTLAERQPKAIKSALVKHAVETHGAKVVPTDEEG